MQKNILQSGAIEFVASEEEKDLYAKIKLLKKKNPKKASDLTKAELEDLVILIAQHLKLL